MADHSRLVLCVFMFVVVAFNPFGNLLPNSNVSPSESWAEKVDGRTILNAKIGNYYLTLSVLGSNLTFNK